MPWRPLEAVLRSPVGASGPAGQNESRGQADGEGGDRGGRAGARPGCDHKPVESFAV
jgi:hypothetical protein